MKDSAEKRVDEKRREHIKDIKERESRKNHRKRVKDKFKRNGYRLNRVEDYELMEFLLFYCIPCKDTKQQAKDLIKRFVSISGVLEADPEVLKEVDGVNEQTVMFFKLLVELYQRYLTDRVSERDTIRSHKDAVDYMKGHFWGEQRECMYVACTGNNGKVLYFRRIAEGEPNSVSVVPADIVKTALRANATRVVLAHNHPFGICHPSSQDLRVTSIISDELRRVGIELFDHVIIAPDGEYSMAEKDMLPSRRE